MATSVQITLIICVTLVILLFSSYLFDYLARRQGRNREVYPNYDRFLAAVAEIKGAPTNKKAWDRLSSATHQICLTAPPAVVQVVMKCSREIHDGEGSLSNSTATSLLVAFRKDLGVSKMKNSEELEFEIIPSKRTES